MNNTITKGGLRDKVDKKTNDTSVNNIIISWMQ